MYPITTTVTRAQQIEPLGWRGALCCGVIGLSLTLSALASTSYAATVEPSLAMGKSAALEYLKEIDVYPAPSNLMGQAVDGNYRAITAMIASGIDPNHKPAVGHTALRMATSFACSAQPTPETLVDIAKTVQVLLAAKANVNEVDASGLGVLMMTSQQCPSAITKLLIDAGADLNQRSPQGFTPLSMALAVENFSSAEVLIKAGARITPDAAKRLLDDTPSAELKAIVKRATAPLLVAPTSPPARK